MTEVLIEVMTEIVASSPNENSYMANLKRLCTFVEEGQTTSAINQLEADQQGQNRYSKG